jgi:peptide deformylase
LILPAWRLARETTPCPRDNLTALYRTCQELEALCLKHEGLGLSAVQVGLPWKLFVARQGPSFRYLLDCECRPIGEVKVRGIEGCLSIKGDDGSPRFFSVFRHKDVEVEGDELVAIESLAIRKVSLTLTGLASVLYQHEIDHQNGILISEIGEEVHLWLSGEN